MAAGWESSWPWSIPPYGSFPLTEAVVNSQEWTLSRSIPELRLVGNPAPCPQAGWPPAHRTLHSPLFTSSFPSLCENWVSFLSFLEILPS